MCMDMNVFIYRCTNIHTPITEFSDPDMVIKPGDTYGETAPPYKFTISIFTIYGLRRN